MAEDAESILNIIQRDLETKLNEYIKKRFEIDKKYIELSQIKSDIYNLKFQKTEMLENHPDLTHTDVMSEPYKTEAFKSFGIVEQSESDEGAIFLKQYKSEFSRILRKEFNKLDARKKRELFKTGLLKVRFYLNYLKYAKNKKEGKETEIDKYVFKRSENFPHYINIKFNDKTIEKLEKIKKAEIENSEFEDNVRNSEIAELEIYEDSDLDYSIELEGSEGYGDDEDSYD